MPSVPPYGTPSDDDKPMRLRDALRRARIEAADRSGVVVELRDAEVARLEILNDALDPLFDQIPPRVDIFDRGISQGDTPRLWIDMVAHVAMGRDKRLYRFVQDARFGRVVLAESHDVTAIVKAVTDYIARRLIEREHALVTAPPPAAALQPRSRRADFTPRDVAPTRVAPARQAPFAPPAVAPVQPAEIPALPPALLPGKPRWTGFYIGGSVGGADQSSPTRIAGVGPNNEVQTSIDAGNVAARLSPSGRNVTFSGQAGFNYQIGMVVLGAETDFSAMHTGGRKSSTVNPFGVQVTTQAQNELFTLGTVRARAGVAFGDLMIFATGGYAYGHLGQRGAINPDPTNNPTYAGSNPQMASGWALGGGLEYALGPMLSLKFDYLRYDLGTQRLVLTETQGFFTDEYATMRAKTRGDMLRMGLNIGF